MKKNKDLQKLVKKLVKLSFADGKILESRVVNSLKLLKSLPRSKSIFALSEYLKYLKQLQKQYTLHIESASKLSQNNINQAKKAIGKRSKITKVVVDVNPELLGGVRFKLGDKIWGDTILDRLEQVREAIVNG